MVLPIRIDWKTDKVLQTLLCSTVIFTIRIGSTSWNFITSLYQGTDDRTKVD